MLSRVANSLFWSSRYTQRAEQLARLLSVTYNYGLELQGILPEASDACWEALATFVEIDVPDEPEELIHRLAFDTTLPQSVLSCVIQSRENARSIRDSISSELWQSENMLFHKLSSAANATPDPSTELALLSETNLLFHTLHGLRDHTMSRGDEWHFMRLGRHLERASGTVRTVDFMFSHPALAMAEQAGISIDSVHLASTLRMCTGYETFSRRVHFLTPERVAEFLLVDTQFPQAAGFAIQEVASALHTLSTTPSDVPTNEAEQIAGRLLAEMRFIGIDEIFRRGLHDYLIDTLTNLNRLGLAIDFQYFR
jgi:uncharacterized alpha-E superfamily protein